MDIIKSSLDSSSKEYIKNCKVMEKLVSELKKKVVFSQKLGCAWPWRISMSTTRRGTFI